MAHLMLGCYKNNRCHIQESTWELEVSVIYMCTMSWFHKQLKHVLQLRDVD